MPLQKYVEDGQSGTFLTRRRCLAAFSVALELWVSPSRSTTWLRLELLPWQIAHMAGMFVVVTNQFKSSRSGSRSLTMVIPSGSMMERAMVAWLEHGRRFVSGPLADTSSKLLAPPYRDDTNEGVRPTLSSPALTRRKAREKHGEKSVANRTRRQTSLRASQEVEFTGQDSESDSTGTI